LKKLFSCSTVAALGHTNGKQTEGALKQALRRVANLPTLLSAISIHKIVIENQEALLESYVTHTEK
jgi:hypothetical protein